MAVGPVHAVVACAAHHPAAGNGELLGRLLEQIDECRVHAGWLLLADWFDVIGQLTPLSDGLDILADCLLDSILGLCGDTADVDADPDFARDDVHDARRDLQDADRADDRRFCVRRGLALNG